VAVRVDGSLVDLATPLDGETVLTPVALSSDEGLEILRHSAAHVMAHAVLHLYGPEVKVAIGPAIDYLLKPFDRKRFQKAIQRVKSHICNAQAQDTLKRIQTLLAGVHERSNPSALSLLTNDLDTVGTSAPERLMIKSGGRIFFLRVDEVDWIEAAGNYVRLHVGSEVYRMRETLGALEDKLDPRRFVRIHRSQVVNLDRIQELQPWFHGEYVVFLKDGTKLKLSRHYKTGIEALLRGQF